MFGRRNRDDEDPFAALKESGTYESGPTSTVPGIPGSAEEMSPQARPNRTPARSSRPARKPARARRRRSRGGGYLIALRLLVPLAVVVALIATVHTGSTVNTPTFSTPGFNEPNPSGSSHIVTTTRRPASYLTAAGLAAGLAQVRHLAPKSRLLLLLRIDSTSLDATVSSGHGPAEEIMLEPTGTLKEPAGTLGSLGISFSQINPAVPPRLVKQLVSRFHVPKSHVSYMVAIAFQGLPPTWGVYLTNDTNYQASLSGAGLHKNG